MNALRVSTCVFAAAAFTLAACAFTPDRRDPFAGLDIPQGQSFAGQGQPAPLSGLTVALIPSQNTLASVESLRKYLSFHGASGVDPEAPVEDSIRVLRAQFRSVFKAKDLAEARANGADVVAVLDVYTVVAEPPHITSSVDVKAAFLAPDGSAIETIGGYGEVSAFKYFAPGSALDAARRQSVAKLEEGLRGAQKLRVYAGTRMGAPTAAVAAGPTPKTGRSDVDEPGYKRSEDPTKFAVVVGVEDYASLPAADYAERDAAAIRRHLLALGYPERNVIYLTGPQAGKSGIEKYVESWLPRNVGADDSVFFYFSGHGAPDPASGQAYLMPWDGDAKFLDTTGYPVKRLYARLSALKAKRVLVALDSCFSGAGGRSVIAKGARPLVTHVDAGLPDSDKLVVIAAASGDEITGAADVQAHGLFTYYLLKALNASGGSASVRSVFEDLKPKVEDAARRDNRDQTPQLLPAAGPADGRF